eukprot:TRINITY_DN34699_c0_g1_i1.p1 TRINITY_DN34699_c0_g1~~TRINITY_DN34699_c0_g1_i1.p1  ORF type:complete len:171 (-),score=35.49 TRINITY_DN34699_c0_g1_i1:390-902(-)
MSSQVVDSRREDESLSGDQEWTRVELADRESECRDNVADENVRAADGDVTTPESPKEDSVEAKLRRWIEDIPVGGGADRGFSETQLAEIASFARSKRLEDAPAEEMYQKWHEDKIAAIEAMLQAEQYGDPPSSAKSSLVPNVLASIVSVIRGVVEWTMSWRRHAADLKRH